MSDFSNIIKKGLLIGIFAILFLPLIQNAVLLIVLPDLKGSIVYPNDVSFSKETWFNAEYQQKKEEYLNSMFGFRSLFVRANNQLAYSLFNKAKANGVIIGKESYLYEINYIIDYTGANYVGDEKINEISNKLKFISDTLKKINKELLILFAPGKASFYPEYIPDNYLPVKNISNYNALYDKVSKLGINHINFGKWFTSSKGKTKYPLYPQHGIHWSWYGAALAGDSLIRYIENLRKIDLPDFKIESISTDQAKYGDYDVADGMNLLFKFKSFDLAYPVIKIGDSTNKTKPKVLVISDSFYWTLENLGIQKCFSNSNFWYYNKQVFPESATKELLTSSLNLKEELQNHEVIILMASETSVKDIGWGFINEAYDFYKGTHTRIEKNSNYYKKVKELIIEIKNNAQWLIDTRNRAKERGISLDSCLILEAMWQIDNTKK